MCGSLFLYSCSKGIFAVIGQQIRIICTDIICNCVTNSVMELVNNGYVAPTIDFIKN